MENRVDDQWVFPLTSLQIGDLQSYLSHLSVFLAPESKKVYILVDNQPWLNELGSRPTHLWQLMVTKSRMSPFANTRGRKPRKDADISAEAEVTSNLKKSESEEMTKWFSLVDAATLSRKRALLPVKKFGNTLISNSKVHRTLYGFIVFEIAWNDVRGMNYLNELQTDTSLAIETKVMKRWEFDSIKQAAKCLSSWFHGTFYEQILLKTYLDSTTGSVFFDAQENLPRTTATEDGGDASVNICSEEGSPSYHNQRFRVYPASVESTSNPLETPPPPEWPYKRRKVMKSISIETATDMFAGEGPSVDIGSPVYSQVSYDSECDEMVASQYKDALILFRFDDRDLPFKLKAIIMSDLRLLTLLEAGLPSWVIFLQSYPGFCHIYRPWMCPLARALYVTISIVTVLIGFYDLYKNVPLLKATASRLFGPLFDWIETWEMITRIRCLGTMLFLHNFQKAVQWFLVTTRTVRSFLKVITEPMLGPLMEFFDVFDPLWSACMQLAESSISAIWTVIEFSGTLVGDFLEIILLPVWYILSFIWNTVISIFYPIFWILWEILYVPIRFAFGTSSLVAFIFTSLWESLVYTWQSLSGLFQLSSQVSEVGSTVKSYEVSIWRSVWNDLFSQVFRAVRAILNGFVAFFATCNRHRLSIYNHVLEFVRRLSLTRKRSRPSDSWLGGHASEAFVKVGRQEDGSPSTMSKKIR